MILCFRTVFTSNFLLVRWKVNNGTPQLLILSRVVDDSVWAFLISSWSRWQAIANIQQYNILKQKLISYYFDELGFNNQYFLHCNQYFIVICKIGMSMLATVIFGVYKEIQEFTIMPEQIQKGTFMIQFIYWSEKSSFSVSKFFHWTGMTRQFGIHNTTVFHHNICSHTGHF